MLWAACFSLMLTFDYNFNKTPWFPLMWMVRFLTFVHKDLSSELTVRLQIARSNNMQHNHCHVNNVPLTGGICVAGQFLREGVVLPLEKGTALSQ